MEFCEICGQSRPPGDSSGVTCSGPCAVTVHASCAAVSGVRLANVDSGIFWFCDQCRRGLHSLTTKDKTAATDLEPLPELPAEVWTEVFRNLSSSKLLKMRLVCRSWRDIVTGCPALMAKLTVTFRDRRNDSDHLLPVQKVSIKTFKQIKPWLPLLGQGLVEIKLETSRYGPSVRVPDVLEALKHTPNLKVFELTGCMLYGKHCTSADFRLEKLEKLVLDNISRHEGRLKIFRKLFPNVRSLKLMWDDDHAVVDPLEVAKFVQRYQHSLEELEVYCSNALLTKTLKFDRLKLKKLTAHEPFEDDARVDESKLVGLLRMHPTLEYLNIQKMLIFNDANEMTLNEICQLLPKLKFLSICANRVDISFLSRLAKLQTFKLCGCDQKSFTSFHRSLSGGRLPNMSDLYLERVHLPNYCLRQFHTTLPNLRRLSLTECKIGSWSAFITALSALALLQNLTLEISSVGKHLQGSSSHHQTLANLKYLTYKKSYTISEETTKNMLITLITMCPGLWELTLKGVQLGQKVLGAIFLNLTQMKTFTVSNCGMKAVLGSYIRQNCRALEELVGWERYD